jgi:uncharacterized membrane protein
MLPKIKWDRDAFGSFAEGFARFMGTAQFLVGMTVIIVVWVLWNLPYGPPRPRFDEYPFIFLTLVLSLQASYAAPLILLAQNRQEDRDRAQAERDRAQARRVQADTEFLAREIASIRLALSDVVTTADLDERVDRLAKAIDGLADPGMGISPAPVSPPGV